MLRDQLVCGIRDVSVQGRLLAEPALTFKKAMELAQTVEMAVKNSKQLQNTPSSILARTYIQYIPSQLALVNASSKIQD